jgi:tungstate transport system ATP-binding protein
MIEPLYRLTGIRVLHGGKPILNLEALDIPEGAFLVVVGPNGAGKTTLLHILAFLLSPEEGRIAFRSFDLAKDRLPLLHRRSVTLVMQQPYFFSGSVLENARYGLRVRGEPKEASLGRAREALDRVGLADLASQKARTLSGGEGKRLAVARAIAVEPKVLLLDEPTADVDEKNVSRIEDLVLALHREKGTTVILSTHDRNQADRLSTQILSLSRGRIAEGPSAPTEPSGDLSARRSEVGSP